MNDPLAINVRRPVLRYHGGKWRIAPWILSHFPAHSCYVEPYAGAASVLLRKPRSQAECINDLDDNIVTVFRVLRDREKAAELQRLLELTPAARSEFEASFEVPRDDIHRAWCCIVRSYMGQGSDAITRGYRVGFRCALRNSANNSLPSHDWAGWPAQISTFVERLQGVAIENADALRVIARLDSPDTLIYCDPPYVHSTRTAKTSMHGYRHEMTDEDHRLLATVLHGVTGMVVLSGYPSDLYDQELYRDWSRHELNTHADRGKKRTEVVWLNSRCVAKQSQSRLFA